MDLKQQILHYYRVDELSLREIARRTGTDRKTVTRLINAYEAAIKETARLTEERLELDENSKEILNERLQIVREYLADRPDLKLTYFVPDERKKGGMYVTVEGKIKKIDEYERMIMLENGVVVLMDDLYAIDGDMFNK